MRKILLPILLFLVVMQGGCGTSQSAPKKAQGEERMTKTYAINPPGPTSLSPGQEMEVYTIKRNEKILLKKIAGEDYKQLKSLLTNAQKMKDDFTFIQIKPDYILIEKDSAGNTLKKISLYQQKESWIIQDSGKYAKGDGKLKSFLP